MPIHQETGETKERVESSTVKSNLHREANGLQIPSLGFGGSGRAHPVDELKSPDVIREEGE
jgi:hypothetical protein